MELSKRLHAVADLVTPGNRLADVGTDHAYIPIFLAGEGRIPHAIAMDVNRGPLQRAQEHIQAEGLTEKIEVRLSDGLRKLKAGEADTVVIAGMGGALTLRILEDGREVLPFLKELILQPQSEITKVRRWLAANDFRIEEEDMVCEDGKYYPMMRVIHGKPEEMTEMEAQYGPLLLQKKSECLYRYLKWEEEIRENVRKQLRQASGEGAMARRREVELALERNRSAQKIIRGETI